MVAKAVELYREKGPVSVSAINKGAADGFRDRDLCVYVFSGGTEPEARIAAHAVDTKLIGMNIGKLRDTDANQLGLDRLARARPPVSESISNGSIRRPGRSSRSRTGSSPTPAASSSAESSSRPRPD